MQRFTQLYFELDQTTRTGEKLAALRRYFAYAPAHDAAWALYFLSGRRVLRTVSHTLLRTAVAEVTGYPMWLVDESYHAVGDLAETLALLLDPAHEPTDWPLHELVEHRIIPLTRSGEQDRRQIITQTWQTLNTRERLVFHKLIAGEFRVGVAQRLLVRALGSAAGVEPAVIAHRLMGRWSPTPEDYERLMHPASGAMDAGQPYPFFLASPLTQQPQELGKPDQWQAEWKWDGAEAQLICRQGQVMIWSRGEELLTNRFPAIVAAAMSLPAGVVLDGELLAWGDDTPLPFAALQKRIGLKRQEPRLFEDVPVIFMAYDVMEYQGRDIRAQPLSRRRSRLEAVIAEAGERHLRLSPVVVFTDWQELAERHAESRQHGVEGLMLKRLDSPYRVGRPRGDWWKWKVDPYSIDAVLIHAQPGHGRRATLFTDYTFGVWENDELVPIAKAYSGLTDAEVHEVDRFVRRNTLKKFGPVRVVDPQLVFELAFEAIARSSRHRSGVALRFPRMAQWRRDKKPADADTLDAVLALLESHLRR